MDDEERGCEWKEKGQQRRKCFLILNWCFFYERCLLLGREGRVNSCFEMECRGFCYIYTPQVLLFLILFYVMESLNW